MQHKQSMTYYQESCRYIPGGVNSPVRAFSSVQETPIFVSKAFGAQVEDVDGNTYLDYICSWGPMILGHAHPLLEEAIKEKLGQGISYGLCCSDEIELAKLICEGYKGVDMVRMVNSGTEATMSAIRVARGYTGRDKIIKFEGCYHGHSDCLLVKAGSGALTFGSPTSPGVPDDMVKHTIVCTYNDLASFQQAIRLHKGEIAAVIIEPIAGNMGVIAAEREFLKGLRKGCDEEGIILIFDEVISGFRIAYGGAAQWYGITPDMACFGKIIGAGLPVGAYGGKKEIMSCVSPIGPIYQAGTLSGNPLAMHLGVTLLRYLKQHPEVYKDLEQKGMYMKQGIQTLLNKYNLPYQIHQVGSLLTLFFSNQIIRNYQDVCTCDQQAFIEYFQSLYKQGILIAPSPFEAMFFSTAHTQAQLDTTLKAMDIALQKVQKQ